MELYEVLFAAESKESERMVTKEWNLVSYQNLKKKSGNVLFPSGANLSLFLFAT